MKCRGEKDAFLSEHTGAEPEKHLADLNRKHLINMIEEWCTLYVISSTPGGQSSASNTQQTETERRLKLTGQDK